MTPGVRRNRVTLVVTGVIILVAAILLYLLRGSLFPFIVGGFLALLLTPVVSAIERRMPWRKRWPAVSRISAILMIFISVLAALGVTLWITIPPASKEAQNFIASVPDFYSETRASFETWTQERGAGLP